MESAFALPPPSSGMLREVHGRQGPPYASYPKQMDGFDSPG